jgi:hypothetical protein
MRPVWIRWIDANSWHGWNSDSDIKDFGVFEGVVIGFLLRENDREVILSRTYVELDNQAPYSCPIAIPKPAIVARGDLTVR